MPETSLIAAYQKVTLFKIFSIV